MAATWPRLLLVLLISGGMAFSSVPAFELVWDDTHLLLHNTVLAGASFAQIFTSDFWLEGERSGYYRPLVTLSYFTESFLFGGSPSGYHVMNVLYHLTATLALIWVGTMLLGDRIAAWLAALVFALHPIHTESVAFVSGRTDVLAALFFLLAFGCYVRAHRDVSRGATSGPDLTWTAGALGAFAAALLAKETAFMLPAVLVSYEACRHGTRGERTSTRSIIRRLIPFLMVAGAYLVARHLVLGTVVQQPWRWESLASRAALGVKVVGSYLTLLVAPYPPNPHYVLQPAPGWASWQIAGGLLAILVTAALALWARRRSRLPLFFFAWFLLTILPATPFLPVGAPQMAERFLYLPSAAFALLLGWAGHHVLRREWMPRPSRIVASAAIASLLLVSLAFTRDRNEDWRDAESLFRRMAESSPRSWLAPVNLGYVNLGHGRPALAASEFRRTLELRPETPAALMGLAIAENQLGRHREAIRLGERVRALEPDSEVWALQLGTIYGNAGDHGAAASLFAEAAMKNPRRLETRYQLALALHQSGRGAEARVALLEADDLAGRLRLPPPGWRQIAERVRSRVHAERIR